MKLYLSSYKYGDDPTKLVNLVGNKVETAVIVNAQDFVDEQTRAERARLRLSELSSIGLAPEEVDLRDYFNKPKETLKRDLDKYGLIFASGGNVFLLRKAMKYSGFDQIIKELLADGIVYGGYSAGACVVTPDMKGIELVDSLELAQIDGYGEEIVWDGLSLVDYRIAPHYKSDHPETDMIDDLVVYFEEQKLTYKPLRDGEVIVINE